jgi:segregation and condensation protein B
MEEIEVLPEVKQIAGALLFAAKLPLSAAEIRKVLRQVAETRGGAAKDFAEVSEADVHAAVDQLRRDLEAAHVGVHVVEVANGYRLQNDLHCGPWLRHMLERGKANRLTKPALETLAIIAYRQPAMRSEIEAVRGVAVDQVLRNLVDLGLVKIVGRSELPGRPWLFGTSQKFLEYFGLKNVQDLPGVEELRRMEAEQKARGAPTESALVSEEEPAPEAGPELPLASPEAEAEAEAPAEEEAATAAEAEPAEPAEAAPAEPDEEAGEADEEYDDDEFEDEDEDEDDDEEADEEEAEDKG